MDSTEAHRQSLTRKHQALENEIAEEMKRPHPDTDHVTELKRQKLRLKEEITAIMEPIS